MAGVDKDAFARSHTLYTIDVTRAESYSAFDARKRLWNGRGMSLDGGNGYLLGHIRDNAQST